MNFDKYEFYKDQFNYYNNITKIDRNYRLIFDKVYKIFCIINIAKNNQICLKFANFNQNIEILLQKTRIERSKNLFKFIDDYNDDLNKKLIKKQINSTSEKLCEISKIYNRINTISTKSINKIIGDNYA